MISVVIPTYNREKVLKRAIDSVLNQTYKDIELIVVDDFSSDGTENLIKEYKDKRLKYVKLSKNCGACHARNTGINEAKGEYIAFQDSDDFWYPNKLEVQLNNMLQNDSDIDFCSIMVNDNEVNKYSLPNQKQNKQIKKYGIYKSLSFGNFISTQTILAKKECFSEIKFDESLPRLQDYDLVLRLSSKYKISFTKEILVDLIVQSDSISKNPTKLYNAVEIMKHKNYYDQKSEHNRLLSILYLYMANAYYNIDNKISNKMYINSLKYKFNLKVLVKYLIVKLKK